MSEGILGYIGKGVRSITNIFNAPVVPKSESLSDACINALKSVHPDINYTRETGQFAEGRFTVIHRPDGEQTVCAVLNVREDVLQVQKTLYIDDSEDKAVGEVVQKLKVPYE